MHHLTKFILLAEVPVPLWAFFEPQYSSSLQGDWHMYVLQ